MPVLAFAVGFGSFDEQAFEKDESSAWPKLPVVMGLDLESDISSALNPGLMDSVPSREASGRSVVLVVMGENKVHSIEDAAMDDAFRSAVGAIENRCGHGSVVGLNSPELSEIAEVVVNHQVTSFLYLGHGSKRGLEIGPDATLTPEWWGQRQPASELRLRTCYQGDTQPLGRWHSNTRSRVFASKGALHWDVAMMDLLSDAADVACPR
ncbi:MAG: hypothetical protein AAF449_11320 [Myxococcota bacterium]